MEAKIKNEGIVTNKKLFKSAFSSLKWFEWIMFLGMIVIGFYYMVTDPDHPKWYLIINYMSSIAGVCCIFLCAHASRPTWLFAIVNTALYIVILFYNKVYGTMALELFYYMPTNILGIIMWKKHQDEKEPDKTKTKVMSLKYKIIMLLIVAAATVGYHFILIKIGGATAWLDALTVSIGVIATYYEIKRFADQYYLWLITDVIAVVQWIQLQDPIMITKKAIYLIMAVVGLYNWIRMQKERNSENI